MLLRLTVEQCRNMFEESLAYGIEQIDQDLPVNQDNVDMFMKAYLACFLDLCENSTALEFQGLSMVQDDHPQPSAIHDPASESIRNPEPESASFTAFSTAGASWYFEHQGESWLKAALSKDVPPLHFRRMVGFSELVGMAFTFAVTVVVSDTDGALFKLATGSVEDIGGLPSAIAKGVAACTAYAVIALGQKLGLDEHCVFIKACKLDAKRKPVTWKSIQNTMPGSGNSCNIPCKRYWRCEFRRKKACSFRDDVDTEGLEMILGHLENKGFLRKLDMECGGYPAYAVIRKRKLVTKASYDE